MYARVARGEMPVDKIDSAKRMIHDQIVSRVRELRGFKGGYWMLDPSSGRLIGVTLFESEEALRASEQQANSIRDEASRSSGMPAPSFEVYEVIESVGSVEDLAA